MKFYFCYLAKDRTQAQNVDITINLPDRLCVYVDDQHPSPGNILVLINTKCNINSAFSLYHIMMYLHVTIYHYIDILWKHYYCISMMTTGPCATLFTGSN